MKQFLSVATIAFMFALSGCASDGRQASYEGFNKANVKNPSGDAGARSIASIPNHIPR